MNTKTNEIKKPRVLKVIKNLFSREEIDEFLLKLYNDLPVKVHNKKL